MTPDALLQLLGPLRPTEVVDVGANPIDGVPPYRAMLDAGLCHVVGFEPQPAAFAALQQRSGAAERYLPHALGDGAVHTLRVCHGSGLSSLLEPDPAALELFEALQPLAQVVERIDLATRRLDDVDEIEHLDWLKLDVQGSELMILRHGAAKLAQAVVVHTEVSFVTLYQGQPPFGEVDLELRRQGFLPHCLAGLKHWPIAPALVDGNPRRALNQLLEADVVYVRDLTQAARMSDEQLRHLALIAHHAYRSFDLALRCVMLLERRGALVPGSQQRYLQIASGTAQ